MAFQLDPGTFAGRQPGSETPVAWAFSGPGSSETSAEYWMLLLPTGGANPAHVLPSVANPDVIFELEYRGSTLAYPPSTGQQPVIWSDPTNAAHRAAFEQWVLDTQYVGAHPQLTLANFHRFIAIKHLFGPLVSQVGLVGPGFYHVWQMNHPGSGLPSLVGWVWHIPGGGGGSLPYTREYWGLRRVPTDSARVFLEPGTMNDVPAFWFERRDDEPVPAHDELEAAAFLKFVVGDPANDATPAQVQVLIHSFAPPFERWLEEFVAVTAERGRSTDPSQLSQTEASGAPSAVPGALVQSRGTAKAPSREMRKAQAQLAVRRLRKQR